MEGTFHPEVRPQEEQWVTCGKLASRRVQCFPAPDAFNPCEDVMGNMVLRVAVWFVVVAAVFGNLAVLLVLLSSRLTVSKFLMCNLAFADLCMGAYLLLIAAEDLHTRGRYFSHAILWQHGAGCKVAGFLTVFASELSIYTLTVITLERWYAITYAVHLNRRLRLRTAARIMACGWGYALLAASLPLLGISSYSKTSICLPMENSTVVDFLYLLTLLSMNGFAFLLICACYAKMYLAISGQRPRSHCGSKDTSVAKRMAMLVFTDFACWAPIAFFGLTAVAGYPLIDVPKSKILLVFFYPLNSCANPFLYAILTKQYRRDLSMLLSTRGPCTRRMLKYTSSWHTTPTNRLLRNKDNSSTSRQTTELSNRTQKGSPHPIKNNFTKLGVHEEFLRRQSLLCEHMDTPI
nr:lutropin-choriogonadotropic hormone receptor-like [Rhipicephalus microplus]